MIYHLNKIINLSKNSEDKELFSEKSMKERKYNEFIET
jgi:hypothetical protein